MPIVAEQLHGMHLPQAIHLFVPLEDAEEKRASLISKFHSNKD